MILLTNSFSSANISKQSIIIVCARLAQSVEHAAVNRSVGGSSPSTSAKKPFALANGFCFLNNFKRKHDHFGRVLFQQNLFLFVTKRMEGFSGCKPEQMVLTWSVS